MTTKLSKSKVQYYVQKYMMCIILFIMVVTLTIAKDSFLTLDNMLNVLRNIATTGTIAFGMTMVIISGEIDLSVGSAIALSSVIVAVLTQKLSIMTGLSTDVTVIFAMVAALLVGIGIGLFYGFILTKFKMPSFIITLAGYNILYGFSAIISNGFPITTLPKWYNTIGAGYFIGVPIPALILIAMFVVVLLIMNHMGMGREIYAVGSNREAARLSGIKVSKIKIFTMTFVQFCAAISGITVSSQVMAGSSTFGKSYEMDVIAAVIIGGASLNGGEGKVTGTLLGILFLGIIVNGMTLLSVDDYVKYVVRGALILFAVLINTLQPRKMLQRSST